MLGYWFVKRRCNSLNQVFDIQSNACQKNVYTILYVSTKAAHVFSIIAIVVVGRYFKGVKEPKLYKVLCAKLCSSHNRSSFVKFGSITSFYIVHSMLCILLVQYLMFCFYPFSCLQFHLKQLGYSSLQLFLIVSLKSPITYLCYHVMKSFQSSLICQYVI